MSAEQLFLIDRSSDQTLQEQLRSQIVQAILDGNLPRGKALPPCRRLSQNLGISRNTVVLVYESLINDGFLSSRERSGYYVSEATLPLQSQFAQDSSRHQSSRRPAPWLDKMNRFALAEKSSLHLNDWQDYEFPFVYGQLDSSLFPTESWRDCTRQAQTVASLKSWGGDLCMEDDPSLIKQIRTRILPCYGIRVPENEILITLGTQNALYLISRLLLTPQSVVGLEDPGYLDVYNIMRMATPHLRSIPVDQNGMRCDHRLLGCDMVYLTPNHQYPTTVTMPLKRRLQLLECLKANNTVIIEDGYEPEINSKNKPTPALKSIDSENRVIFCSGFSKSLASGLRLGYMVADAEFIESARLLRRWIMRHPPLNNQRTVALMIIRGNFDVHLRKLQKTLKERHALMADSITKHFPKSFLFTENQGGTCFWIQAPAGFDAPALLNEAKKYSILFESGDVFFHSNPPPKNYFRLGFAAIPSAKIEAGIQKLATLL